MIFSFACFDLDNGDAKWHDYGHSLSSSETFRKLLPIGRRTTENSLYRKYSCYVQASSQPMWSLTPIDDHKGESLFGLTQKWLREAGSAWDQHHHGCCAKPGAAHELGERMIKGCKRCHATFWSIVIHDSNMMIHSFRIEAYGNYLKRLPLASTAKSHLCIPWRPAPQGRWCTWRVVQDPIPQTTGASRWYPSRCFLKGLAKSSTNIIWRFLKMGVPPQSSNLKGFSHHKPLILGYPHLWNPPYHSLV